MHSSTITIPVLQGAPLRISPPTTNHLTRGWLCNFSMVFFPSILLSFIPYSLKKFKAKVRGRFYDSLATSSKGEMQPLLCLIYLVHVSGFGNAFSPFKAACLALYSNRPEGFVRVCRNQLIRIIEHVSDSSADLLLRVVPGMGISYSLISRQNEREKEREL